MNNFSLLFKFSDTPPSKKATPSEQGVDVFDNQSLRQSVPRENEAGFVISKKVLEMNLSLKSTNH